MKKILAIIVILVCHKKEAFCQINIYLRDYKTYVSPKKCIDTMNYYLYDSSHININLINCKGKMNLSHFDKTNILLEKGSYCESLDTLKQYTSRTGLEGDLIEIKVTKYFEPLKDGLWIYYENGKELRREKYRKGILQK